MKINTITQYVNSGHDLLMDTLFWCDIAEYISHSELATVAKYMHDHGDTRGAYHLALRWAERDEEITMRREGSTVDFVDVDDEIVISFSDVEEEQA